MPFCELYTCSKITMTDTVWLNNNMFKLQMYPIFYTVCYRFVPTNYAIGRKSHVQRSCFVFHVDNHFLHGNQPYNRTLSRDSALLFYILCSPSLMSL